MIEVTENGKAKMKARRMSKGESQGNIDREKENMSGNEKKKNEEVVKCGKKRTCEVGAE